MPEEYYLIFEDALKRQIREFPVYKDFVADFSQFSENDIHPIVTNGELYRIPALPADYFKKSNDLFRRLSKTELAGR